MCTFTIQHGEKGGTTVKTCATKRIAVETFRRAQGGVHTHVIRVGHHYTVKVNG